jgi:hypothetical protein
MTNRAVPMPRRTTKSPAQATIGALQDLASGNLAEQLRIEAAARILVLAKHAAELSARGFLPCSQGETPVDRLVARWEPTDVTAAEFAELLTPAERDRLIAEAPAWAAARLPGEALRAA